MTSRSDRLETPEELTERLLNSCVDGGVRDFESATALLTAYLSRRDAEVREAAIRECVAACDSLREMYAKDAQQLEDHGRPDFHAITVRGRSEGASRCACRLRGLLPAPSEPKGGERG